MRNTMQGDGRGANYHDCTDKNILTAAAHFALIAVMIFTAAIFVAFFLVVLAVYWALPHRAQNLFLLAASYVFYGYVHPWFCILLATSTLTDYLCAIGMAKVPSRRRLFLIASLLVNLGMLAAFKYYNFFAENVQEALALIGWNLSLPVLNVILPVGLSFYTFQTLSYTIDVYRGHLEPRRNLVDVAVFVSMFPQLVAGPIERARNLLPQIESRRRASFAQFESGICLIAWGYFQKLVIADNLAIYCDRIYAQPQLPGLMILAGGVAFMAQILADFGGYTDIARGCARLLGFELVRNFDRPYSATNVPELWRRWHMSLTSWIRDYVFYSLPNARRSRRAAVSYSMLTMLLFGLWHGAAWNFIVWGIYVGVCVAAHQLAFRKIARWLTRHMRRRTVAGLGFCLTNVHAVIASLLFRQQDFGVLAGYVTRNPFPHTPEEVTTALGILVVSAALSLPMLLRLALLRWIQRWIWLRTLLVWICVCGIVFLGREGRSAFIYFAF